MKKLLSWISFALLIALASPADAYSYAHSGIVLAANGDMACFQGAAGSTPTIKRISVSGFVPTATSGDVSVIRRSTANTGGTTVATGTVGKWDIGFGAPNMGITVWSTPGTSGTSAGALEVYKATVGPVGLSPFSQEMLKFNSSESADLKGTSDFLCINLAGFGVLGVITGASFDFTIEWTE